MSSRTKTDIRITIIWAGGTMIGSEAWYWWSMSKEFEYPEKMEFCTTENSLEPSPGEHLWEAWFILEALSLEISAELKKYRMGSVTLAGPETRARWMCAIFPKSFTSFGLCISLFSCILPRPISYMILYPGFRLVFGTLYPAYASYKAVRTKNVKEYVKWMMYWIVFALFTCAETFTDLFFSFWFPFYYEIKIIIVIYLLSPATKGSSILYRKFVHPALIQREQEIDEYLARAKEQGYHTVLSLGSKGVNYATSILMQTALKGGGGLVNHIRKSYSVSDLPIDPQLRRRLQHDETDDTFSSDTDMGPPRRRRGTSSPCKVSSGSQVDLYFTEMDVRDSPAMSENFIPSHIRSSEDVSSGYVSPEPSELRDEVKDRLVRSSSVSMANRVRTRASTRADRHSSLIEEADDEGSNLSDESHRESQSPNCLSSFPNSGKTIDPIVRPHLQYLFSNLTEEQLLALVSSATHPGMQSKPSETNAECGETKLEPIRPESIKEGPSKLLESLLNSAKPQPVSSELEAIETPELNKSVFSTKNEEFRDCINYETKENPLGASSPNSVGEDSQNSLSTEVGGDKFFSQTKIENNIAIRRPKKRQAPVPPVGGSLVDLSRLSQISDQLEVSSLLDFDAVLRTPNECSVDKGKSSKTNTKHDGDSNISRMLQFPKLSFSFWQKNGKNSPSPTPDISEKVNTAGASSKSDSFVSLHDDNSRGGMDFREKGFREMSQSPSSKRRSFV